MQARCERHPFRVQLQSDIDTGSFAASDEGIVFMNRINVPAAIVVVGDRGETGRTVIRLMDTFAHRVASAVERVPLRRRQLGLDLDKTRLLDPIRIFEKLDAPVSAFDLITRRPSQPGIVPAGKLLAQCAARLVVQTLKYGTKTIEVPGMQVNLELAWCERAVFEFLEPRHHVRNHEFGNDLRSKSFHGHSLPAGKHCGLLNMAIVGVKPRERLNMWNGTTI
jgi:hypothetical protein